jgi:hypothetical protein
MIKKGLFLLKSLKFNFSSGHSHPFFKVFNLLVESLLLSAFAFSGGAGRRRQREGRSR